MLKIILSVAIALSAGSALAYDLVSAHGRGSAYSSLFVSKDSESSKKREAERKVTAAERAERRQNITKK